MIKRILKARSFIEGISRSRDGFTLIEILIVITIIAILSAIVVPRLMDMPQKARVTKAKADINAFSMALSKFSMEHSGNYPTNDEGLGKLVEEGYVKKKKDVLLDPWGHPYLYRYPGEVDKDEPEIWSLGADGKEGGEGFGADIKSWE